MSPSPDPDDKLERMAAVFRAAAEKSTGPARRKFIRLSEAFNALQNLANTAAFDAFEGAKAEFNAAMDDVRDYAKTDPSAQRILMELSRDILMIEDEAAAPAAGLPKPPPKKQPQTPPPAPPQKNPRPVPAEKKKPGRHWNI
ncbi:MAG: hypothetical protein KGQ70_08945 [Alphaproteobacteria bacterium]|nr:hypothetical protein [Alphaproteobacteria bacterium]